MNDETIVTLLKWSRMKAGLTQSEVAERAGLNQCAVSRMENSEGGVSIKNIVSVCDALGLELQLRLKK